MSFASVMCHGFAVFGAAVPLRSPHASGTLVGTVYSPSITATLAKKSQI